MGNKLIKQLLAVRGLKIECPSCSEVFSIKRAKPFGMYDSYPHAVQRMLRERLNAANELRQELKQRKKSLAEDRKKKPQKITVSAQASNFGQISEQILPAFVTFPYRQAECRILFKPIDYLVFVNLAKAGRVERIKFVDVKTGDARLDKRQRQIRDRILEGRIKHKVIG